MSRIREAFKESYNLVAMACATGLSAAMLDPRPFLAGMVAEAAYLLFVPDSGWYRARVAAREEAARQERRKKLREEILPTLRPAIQSRFLRLEAMRMQIAAQPMDDQNWFHEVLGKLDYLLEKFLIFGAKEAQFRSYLLEIVGSAPAPEPRRNDPRGRQPQPPSLPDWAEAADEGAKARILGAVGDAQQQYDAEIEGVKRLMEQEQDPDTKAVLEKRLDVLQRRHVYVGKIGKILTNLTHQIELLEDTFGLINDEMRARSPEQVLSDIDDVVYQTDSMTKLLDEMAPYDQLVARLGTQA